MPRMIAVSSTAAVLDAIRNAREVTFCSYVLPHGAVERALERAAQRGAHVTVRLEGYFYGGGSHMRGDNEWAVRRLRALGADAAIVHRAGGNGAAVHLKAAVCDHTAFLDDCNWRGDGRETILREDGRKAAGAIRTAALGQDGISHTGIALNKTDALAAETAVFPRGVRTSVDVEAESIGLSTVYSALKRLAQRGARCRLLVSKFGVRGKYGHLAALLAQAGVRVRVAGSDEKIAVSGTRAWVGSANPTSTYLDGDQLDWGIGTRDAALVRALQARFNANWKTSEPLSLRK